MLTTYTYDKANRLKQANAGGVITTYTADAAGNRTRETSPTRDILYTWNAAGQMATAEPPAGTMEFTYNADGQRVAKQSTDGSVTGYLYDYKRLLHETDEVGGTISKTYAADTTDEFGDLIGEDGEYLHQYDAQADTHALLDNTGTVEAQYKYNAFGQVQAVSVAGGPWSGEDWYDLPLELTSNMLAGGKKQYYLDLETSLYLLGSGQTAGGGRYYDAPVGKFLSEDPIRHQAGDTNLFRYVENNPVNRLDAGGHDPASDAADEERKRQQEAAQKAAHNQPPNQPAQTGNVPGGSHQSDLQTPTPSTPASKPVQPAAPQPGPSSTNQTDQSSAKDRTDFSQAATKR